MSTTSHTRSFKAQRTARAFTLIELVISIAIIFLLITTAFYALKTAKRSASRTESLNALRQMMTAYTAYTEDHKGRLMPGYVDAAMIGTGPTKVVPNATLPTGEILNEEDSSSYVWRLAPYLDNAWKTFMADYRSAEVESKFVEEYSCGSYVCPAPFPAGGVFGPGSAGAGQIGISAHPAFGLNSLYLGGDTTHGDPILSPFASWPNPNPGTIAAVRMSEVKSAAKIIVFAPVQSLVVPAGVNVNVKLGYPVLTAPYANFDRATQTALSPQWQFDAATGQAMFIGMGADAGLPLDRLDAHKVPVGHLDGSVTSDELESFGPSTANAATRMSRWSPFAVGEN